MFLINVSCQLLIVVTPSSYTASIQMNNVSTLNAMETDKYTEIEFQNLSINNDFFLQFEKNILKMKKVVKIVFKECNINGFEKNIVSLCTKLSKFNFKLLGFISCSNYNEHNLKLTKKNHNISFEIETINQQNSQDPMLNIIQQVMGAQFAMPDNHQDGVTTTHNRAFIGEIKEEQTVSALNKLVRGEQSPSPFGVNRAGGDEQKNKDKIESYRKSGLRFEIPAIFNGLNEDAIKVHMNNMRKILDKLVFGNSDLKQKIIEKIEKAVRTGEFDQYRILLVGQPGIGKTHICNAISAVLAYLDLLDVDAAISASNYYFADIKLNQENDITTVFGSDTVYTGASVGSFSKAYLECGSIDALMRIYKTYNGKYHFLPKGTTLVFLDEIDKFIPRNSTNRLDAQRSFLNILDQSGKHYSNKFDGIKVNLSKIFIIAAANDIMDMDKTLLNRFDIVHLTGYTSEEKSNIIRYSILPRELEQLKDIKNYIDIGDDAIAKIVSLWGAARPGIREIDKVATNVIDHAAKMIRNNKVKKVVKITAKNILDFVDSFTKSSISDSEKIQLSTKQGRFNFFTIVEQNMQCIKITASSYDGSSRGGYPISIIGGTLRNDNFGYRTPEAEASNLIMAIVSKLVVAYASTVRVMMNTHHISVLVDQPYSWTTAIPCYLIMCLAVVSCLAKKTPKPNHEVIASCDNQGELLPVFQNINQLISMIKFVIGTYKPGEKVIIVLSGHDMTHMSLIKKEIKNSNVIFKTASSVSDLLKLVLIDDSKVKKYTIDDM